MSKFPRATRSQGWTGITEAPARHLSPVTLTIFPLAKPIQSLQPDPSASGLSWTCDSQQLWIHRSAQVSPLAQQQKAEERGDTQCPQAL